MRPSRAKKTFKQRFGRPRLCEMCGREDCQEPLSTRSARHFELLFTRQPNAKKPLRT